LKVRLLELKLFDLQLRDTNLGQLDGLRHISLEGLVHEDIHKKIILPWNYFRFVSFESRREHKV
jgi:hypothetical protein